MSWTPSSADADDHGGSQVSVWPKAYLRECAACHVPFQPRMLPAASWGRLMGRLDQHFGTEATFDSGDMRAVSQWLRENAASSGSQELPVQDRVTRSRWFERKHRHVEAATWRLPSVRSAVNCAACHVGAAQGRFSEHSLRMPAGLSERQRAAWTD